MAKTIECPNCDAPMKVEPGQPTFTCAYCGAQSKNTIFIPPKPATSPRPARTGSASRLFLIYAIVSGGSTVLIGVVGLVIYLLSGPGKTTTTTTSPSTVRTVVKTSSKKAQDPDIPREEKLRAHLYCTSHRTHRIRNSRLRYLGWVKDPKNGPTCKERYLERGVPRVGPFDTCKRNLDRVNKAVPRLPALERAGQRYLAALATLHAVSKEAHEYYAEKDYEDDGCAAGKAFHPRLLAAWDELFAADRQVEGEVRPRHEAMMKRRVARGDKSLPAYHFARSVLATWRLRELIRRHHRSGGSLAALKSAEEELHAASQGVEAITADRRGPSKNVLGIRSLPDQLKKLERAAKQYRRRVRKGKGHSHYDRQTIAWGSGETVDGSLAKVESAYYDVMQDVSRVSFRYVR